jgi:hypothetical protein
MLDEVSQAQRDTDIMWFTSVWSINVELRYRILMVIIRGWDWEWGVWQGFGQKFQLNKRNKFKISLYIMVIRVNNNAFWFWNLLRELISKCSHQKKSSMWHNAYVKQKNLGISKYQHVLYITKMYYFHFSIKRKNNWSTFHRSFYAILEQVK